MFQTSTMLHRKRPPPPPPLHCPQVLAAVVAIFVLGAADATSFNFRSLTLGSLKLLGDAHLKNGSIRLTRDLPVPTSGAGRALFADPVRLRHPTTGLPLPFSTFFSFSVTDLNPSSAGGGLAFVLTSDDSSVGDAGGFLGVVNATAPPGASSVVAVEFDTVMDVEFEDINGNHVGLDLNSMVSAQAADLDSAGIDLKSGDLVHAWIEYGGGDGSGVLEVFVSDSTARPADPVMSFPVDLGRFVEDFMYVGFSGSTQGSTEVHSIEWWSFSSPSIGDGSSSASTPPPPATNQASTTSSVFPPPSPGPSTYVSAEGPSNGTVSHASMSSCQSNGLCRQGPGAVAGVATAGVFIVAAVAGVGFWVFTRKAKSVKRYDNLIVAPDVLSAPRQFSYKELTAATRSFDVSRVIGHGAFGTVYKGIIPETGAIVAVKRCIQRAGSSGSAAEQGRAEFLSELAIIASLRHRNLVRLQGWCQEKGEILLVYDYMLHGSLDKVLFDPKAPTLAWRHRKKILVGVASALAYLHRECERQVIHRDVKSSNVMLDEGYQARLGDFGLARQVEHDKSPDATVTAGTMGYLAPEYLLTGRATDKTDVFSFGAVALEVACGRRPIDGDETRNAAAVAAGGSSSRKASNLVEWVWGLHGEGKMLEAADRRLGGEFEEGEMRRMLLVGLACSSPDPLMRPGMRSVVQMLSGEADPPFVPASKPSMSFSTNPRLLLSLQDSVSDYNGMGFNLSGSTSSFSSLTSTLRGGGGGPGGVVEGGGQ